MSPVPGDAVATVTGIADSIAAAASEGAELVVFPEAAITGYVFDSPEAGRIAAISIPGPELDIVSAACADAGVHTALGAIEVDGGSLYNTAVVVGPDGLIGRYRKTHTLCLGVDRFTTPGDAPPPVFELPFGRIGLNICYDGTFPEVARLLKLSGAQLILLVTNWPVLAMKVQQTQMRAYENHVNYFAVNRIGTENGTLFEGGSIATGYRGEVLATGRSGPDRIHVDFDLPGADATRVVVEGGEYEFDYVHDRRPDLYGGLVEPLAGRKPSGSQRA